MRIMRIILIILIFSSVPTVKADVITSYFYSDALGYDMYYQIVLPPSYESNPDSTYPSIYFLHGFGLDYSWYGSVVSVFEDMMAEKSALLVRISILIFFCNFANSIQRDVTGMIFSIAMRSVL